MRRIQAGLLLAVLWGTGCANTKDADEGKPGDEPLELDLFKSGSRLKVQAITTSDGLRWVESLYDSRRKVGCSWATVAHDGASYCVSQDGVFTLPLPGNRGQYFFDANCTEGLLVNRGPAPSSTVLAQRTASGELQRLHALGVQVTATPYYLDHNTGACAQLAVPSGYIAYRAGPEVTAGSLFVRGQVTPKLTRAGFTLHFMEGQDGFLGFSDIRDTARDTACVIARAKDQKLRCLPTGDTTAFSLGYTNAFANATCTERALASAFVVPRFGVATQGDRCDESRTVYDIGAELTQVHIQFGNMCEPTTDLPAGLRFFRTRNELPAANFLEAREGDLKTYGRLKVRGAELDGVLKLPREIHDTQLGAECGFLPDSQGTLRCFPKSEAYVPISGNRPTYYSDATCTRVLAATYGETCAPSRYVNLYENAGSNTLSRTYALGARYEGIIHGWIQEFPNEPPGCRQVEHPSGYTFYNLGEEIPATSLVQGTVRVD